MKTLLSLTVLVFSFNLLASTHEIVVGSVYQGEEEIKERPTGRSCQIKILSLTPAARGRHCFEVTMQVMHETLNLAVPLKVVSRITNYHRPEYPQIKTCAKTLDSRTD